MEHCGTGATQQANKVKMADRRTKVQETQLPLDVAQRLSVIIISLRKFQCWNFRNFFGEMNLLFTLKKY